MNTFMKMSKVTVCVSILFVSLWNLNAAPSSALPGTENIPVETHLRVDVKSETDEILFVTDNNDPDVVTKAYKLKNASPAVVRGYVLNAIGGAYGTLENAGYGAKKIDESLTKVEAIEYNDGTGVLIVSAEEYKFNNQPEGALSIDELINELDLPEIVNSSGSSIIMYFPVSRVALCLKQLLENVGALTNNSVQELDRSRTVITVDTELNALIIQTPRFKKKEILRMIGEYDRPVPEAKVKCTIYEVNVENDEKVGNDFKAWKNGMGSDAFSAGATFSNGWTGSASRGYPSNNNWQSVDFIQFSPQWSTQYLDFLQTSGYAKIVTTGELEVLNGCEGTITKSTFVPYYTSGEELSGSAITIGDLVAWSANDNGADSGGTAGTEIQTGYKVGVDKNGDSITAGSAIGLGEMTVTKIVRGDTQKSPLYTLKITSGTGYFKRKGLGIGTEVDVYGFYESFTLSSPGAQTTMSTVSWQSTPVYEAGKGTERTTDVLDYGYTLSIIPSICAESTTLKIAITNESMIGFQSNGLPRLVTSDIKTDVMVSNSRRKFAIGGVTNSSLVKATSKVPFLGDLPGIGWLFKTEYDTVKETKMIAVIECELHPPHAPLTGGVLEAIGEVDGAITERNK